MPAPYRDETETLRAENARLRAALAKHRRGGRGVAVALVALDFVAIEVLRPWLNGGSDLAFWGGAAVVVGLAVSAVWSAVGARGRD